MTGWRRTPLADASSRTDVVRTTLHLQMHCPQDTSIRCALTHRLTIRCDNSCNATKVRHMSKIRAQGNVLRLLARQGTPSFVLRKA